jgi:esterase/lipase superfamily enzyme
MPLGLMAAGLITGFALTGMVVTAKPGRVDQKASLPVVRRWVASVILAQRIRAYAAMAQAHSLCLVRQGALSSSQAVQALKITLQDLGIDPVVLENPLV